MRSCSLAVALHYGHLEILAGLFNAEAERLKTMEDIRDRMKQLS